MSPPTSSPSLGSQGTCLGTREASASVYFSFQGRRSPLCNAQQRQQDTSTFTAGEED